MSALFQESDRIETADPEGGDPQVEYRASRASILRRLDLMGCTAGLAKSRFEDWKARQIELENSLLEDEAFREALPERKTLEALMQLTWDEWQERIPDVLATFYARDEPTDEVDRHLRSHDEDSWLWCDGYNSLISLRAIIEAVSHAQVIALDVGPLIGGGWIGEHARICDEKTRIVAARGQPSGPTIVLAEGKSDIEVLKASIRRFHPDLTEFITFLDHSEFKVDGGASYVVKFLKAFAASRVPANIVAVFDNDAAGLVAYRHALSLKLPDNMECIHLPDIELARAYPTIGPQGNHDADINGRACGIELYLGREALLSNGTLRAVRWTSYDDRSNTYQGEVGDKEAVREAFLAAMRQSIANIETEYPEMQLVWQSILDAATRVAERAQVHGRAPPDL